MLAPCRYFGGSIAGPKQQAYLGICVQQANCYDIVRELRNENNFEMSFDWREAVVCSTVACLVPVRWIVNASKHDKT